MLLEGLDPITLLCLGYMSLLLLGHHGGGVGGLVPDCTCVHDLVDVASLCV